MARYQQGRYAGIAADHLATEQLLRSSGVAYTFLRNSLYMEILLQQAARMVAEGNAAVPPAEVRIGYVSRGDCAAAAAAVLSPGHDNQSYDITGPELIGVREIAAAATAATGKPIGLIAADRTPRPRAALAALPLPSPVLRWAELTGRPATSIRAFLAQNRAQLGA